MTTVSLATLNTADKKSFVAALGDVYEQAPWVAEAVHAGQLAADDITPARLYGNMPDGFAGLPGVEFRDEANRRKSVPGWLLSAHLG